MTRSYASCRSPVQGSCNVQHVQTWTCTSDFLTGLCVWENDMYVLWTLGNGKQSHVCIFSLADLPHSPHCFLNPATVQGFSKSQFLAMFDAKIEHIPRQISSVDFWDAVPAFSRYICVICVAFLCSNFLPRPFESLQVAESFLVLSPCRTFYSRGPESLATWRFLGEK